MKSFTVFLVLFVTGSLCLADRQANEYIDNVLSTSLPSEVRSLQIENKIASDFEFEFEDHVKVFGTVKGKAEFENGSVEGLEEIKRESECHSRHESKLKLINCTISFDKLKVKYDGKVKYGKFSKINMKGKAKVSDTHIFLEIVQDYPMQPIIRNFTYIQKGTAPKVQFTGVGPLNRHMSSILEEGYAKHVHSMLYDAMSQRLQYAINRAISKDVLP